MFSCSVDSHESDDVDDHCHDASGEADIGYSTHPVCCAAPVGSFCRIMRRIPDLQVRGIAMGNALVSPAPCPGLCR